MLGKPPLLNAVLRWVLVALVIANVASEMVYTLLPIHLSRMGATPTQIGLVFTGGGLFIALLQFFGGWISDRLGRLKAIAIGSVIATLGYLGFWLAPSWPWIFPAICLEFVSAALVGPSFSALIADQSSPENRGKTFGIMRGVLSVVTILGPLIGGVISNFAGFRMMFGLAFILYSGAALLRIWLARRYRPATPPHLAAGGVTATPTFSTTLRTMLTLLASGGVITWILVTDGGRDIAFNLSADLLPVYLVSIVNLTVAQVGVFRSLRGGASILATLGSGWLSDQLGESRMMVLGFLLQAFGLGLIVVSPTPLGLAIAAVSFGSGIGVLFPAFDSLISKAVPENMRGMAYGLFDSSRNLLAMPGPILGGFLWDRVSPHTPFLLTAFLNLICVMPAAGKLRQTMSLKEPSLKRIYPEPALTHPKSRSPSD
jgi:MFS family permease